MQSLADTRSFDPFHTYAPPKKIKRAANNWIYAEICYTFVTNIISALRKIFNWYFCTKFLAAPNKASGADLGAQGCYFIALMPLM
jgi:hypothetical protein